MGATTFTSYAWGRSPDEAFRSVRESAAWKNGHGGYTGTIAEKHSYVLAALPPRAKAETFLSLLERASDFRGVDYARGEPARLSELLVRTSTADKPALRKRIRDAEANVKKLEREQARFVRSAGALLPALEAVGDAYEDKWGPAVAVEVTGAERKRISERLRSPQPKRGHRLFAFTGWASC